MQNVTGTAATSRATTLITSLPAPRPVSDRYPTEPLNADASAALDRLAHAFGSAPTRVDVSAPDGEAIRTTVENGGHLELHDSARPDVAPIVLDDFLMAVMRGEVA